MTKLDCELQNLRAAKRKAPGTDAAGEVIHAVISAATAGDNVLIAPPGRIIEIVELFLWNGVGAQTLILKDGPMLILTRLTAVPIAGGILLGFPGNNQPHFRVAAGNSLILNLSVGSQVDGFVKYRVQA